MPMIECYILKNIDIINCTRRSTYPEQEDFWCEGAEGRLELDHSSTSVRGPPCFIPSGDKVMVEVQWTNPGVARLTQSIKYITPFLLELPWIGVETEVCDFLDDGKGCQANAQVRIKIINIFFSLLTNKNSCRQGQAC